MKKLYLLLSMLIFTTLLIGCSNANLNTKVTINKESKNESVLDVGVDYHIESLEKAKYDIQIYAKEYNYGKLKENHDLLQIQSMIKNKTRDLSIGLHESDGNLQVNITQVGVEDSSLGFLLDFFSKSENGLALSILDNKKEVQLDKELPIAVYSTNKKGVTTESINLDKDFKIGKNENDLVIYLKMNKLK